MIYLCKGDIDNVGNENYKIKIVENDLTKCTVGLLMPREKSKAN